MTQQDHQDDAPAAEAPQELPRAPEDTSSALKFSTVRRTPLFVASLILALGLGVLIGNMGGSSTPPAPHQEQEHRHEHDTPSPTWTCSMHPQVQSGEPGTCPICGMDLVPSSDMNGDVPLRDAQVRLGPRARALARIRTTAVKTSALEGMERELLGRVSPDESTLRAVTTWAAGRVDKLLVSTTGEQVRQGQVLAKMYSPAVYAAHQDLLVALRHLEEVGQADEYTKSTASSQLEAARQRLRLLGFVGKELQALEHATRPWTSFPIRSTASGTVLRREVRQGEWVPKGEVLFELANLKTVWVELDAYSSDLEHLEVGQTLSLDVDDRRGGALQGTIAFIDPVVDPSTRTGKVRVEVHNAFDWLKPGMYARATVSSQFTRPGAPLPLVVPKSAPLFAGARSLVYVELDTQNTGPIYEAREVALGELVGEQYVVRAGLKRGERVVTHGAFALDSELQIRGRLGLIARHDDRTRQETSRVKLSEPERILLRPVVLGYLGVQENLANDDLAQARKQGAAWVRAIEEVELEQRLARDEWERLSRRLARDASAVTQSKTLEDARRAFSGATGVLDDILGTFGNVLDESVRKAFCPMAHDDQGDHWYQRAEEVDNVYFGNQMRRCGEIERVVESGGYVTRSAEASHGH